MIAQNIPGHLLATARTGLLTARRDIKPLWSRVATEMTLGKAAEDLVDLGGAPMPKRSLGGMTAQDFIEKQLRVAPVDWDITVWISYNAVADDQTGVLERRVKNAVMNFDKHVNKLVFDAINSGGSIGSYGATYDGLALFSASHADKGAAYSTAQSNVNTLSLTVANFDTVYASASLYKDDQGEEIGVVPNLMIVPPAQKYNAAQVAANERVAGTANNDINPYNGEISYIVVPWMDSTSWYLVSANEDSKPLMVVMRERPNLQSAWFDPAKPDGGHYYFKYFARYQVAYGDWRLITQGNT